MSFSVIPHSQTIYGSLVETFGPYFQFYTKNFKTRIFLAFEVIYVRVFNNLQQHFLDVKGFFGFFVRVDRAVLLV